MNNGRSGDIGDDVGGDVSGGVGGDVGDDVGDDVGGGVGGDVGGDDVGDIVGDDVGGGVGLFQLSSTVNHYWKSIQELDRHKVIIKTIKKGVFSQLKPPLK